MTDNSVNSTQASNLHTSLAATGRLKKRYRNEVGFKFLGLGAVGVAILFLIILLWTIVGNAYLAFTYNYISLPVTLDQAAIDPEKTGDLDVIGQADFGGLVKKSLKETLPFADGRRERRLRNGLLTSDAGIQLREAVLADPTLIGGRVSIPIQFDDVGDLHLKNQITKRNYLDISGTLTPSGKDGSIDLVSSKDDFIGVLAVVKDRLIEDRAALTARISASQRSEKRLTLQIADLEGRLSSELENSAFIQTQLERNKKGLQTINEQIETNRELIAKIDVLIDKSDSEASLAPRISSFLVKINGGVVKATSINANRLSGDVLVPLKNQNSAQNTDWTLEMLVTPEDNRKLSDREIAWLDHLKTQGFVERKFNTVFFASGASREPEQAGILGAVMGSFYTMLVTLILSFPIGVSAAIYLEEFAPRNRLTQLIEVNINNLAAVPSIVFGLLGLAMFLNVFGLPRSAPLVGGMVLALMTLPTIIIASRAALRSVPPSIREAALGVGASPLQAVFHHVLPLAMPGILTGTIIGMAQALGETAPLLMIGMVAFIVDVPGGIFDPSTVLPVQIFMWADFPEPAFQQKTSAAILVLLGFLVTMNALAVVLRKRFERRW